MNGTRLLGRSPNKGIRSALILIGVILIIEKVGRSSENCYRKRGREPTS